MKQRREEIKAVLKPYSGIERVNETKPKVLSVQTPSIKKAPFFLLAVYNLEIKLLTSITQEKLYEHWNVRTSIILTLQVSLLIVWVATMNEFKINIMIF